MRFTVEEPIPPESNASYSVTVETRLDRCTTCDQGDHREHLVNVEHRIHADPVDRVEPVGLVIVWHARNDVVLANLLDEADEHGGGILSVASEVGHLLEGPFAPEGLFIIDRVEIDQAHRGRRLSLWAVEQFIQQVTHPERDPLIALEARAFGDQDGGSEPALAAHWSGIGFAPIRPGSAIMVWNLGEHLQRLDDVGGSRRYSSDNDED